MKSWLTTYGKLVLQLGLLYLVVLSLFIGPWWYRHVRYVQATESPTHSQRGAAERSAIPQRILLNRTQQVLTIVPGVYQKNTWEVSADKAHFVESTDLPGQNHGRSVVYGHNTPQVFGQLQDLEVFDQVSLELADGRTLKYRLVKTMETVPSDVSVLNSSATPELVLITCKGWANSKRLVLIFEPITLGASK